MSSLRNNIVKFLSKIDYDVTRPNLDLHDYHPQIRILLLSNGVFFNNTDSKLRFVWPFLSCFIAVVAVAFELMFVIHGIMVEDYAFSSECFCYLIMVVCIPIVYLSVLFRRNTVIAVVNAMAADFEYICNHLGPSYKITFLEGQLLIWKLCFAWLAFTIFIGSSFALSPLGFLLYQSLFATQHEYMVRPLMFPMWLPEDDPYRTPNYEIFTLLDILLITFFIQTFCVYMYMQFHILIHYIYIMEMIIMDFKVIFEGLDPSVTKLNKHDPRRMKTQGILNSRMKRIVEWHNSVYKAVESVSTLYGPPLAYQIMISAILICVIAYQIAETLDEGKINVLFSMLLVASIVQLFIPCYLGTKIQNKNYEVGEACWDCGWHESSLGILLRSDIVTVIMRTQKPLTIKFTGLPKVQLETFSSVMSSAYSYFNMLRQYSANIK